MACNTREHSDGLPRKACGINFLNKVQGHEVLDPFPKEVGLDKNRRAEGDAEDVDAIFVGPLRVAVRVRRLAR